MQSFAPFSKNFGFGFMRLPMNGDQVDIPQTMQMVDRFLEAGFTYFDTAHGYLGGMSELAIRECLASRYPRERFFLTKAFRQLFSDRRGYSSLVPAAAGSLRRGIL